MDVLRCRRLELSDQTCTTLPSKWSFSDTEQMEHVTTRAPTSNRHRDYAVAFVRVCMASVVLRRRSNITVFDRNCCVNRAYHFERPDLPYVLLRLSSNALLAHCGTCQPTLSASGSPCLVCPLLVPRAPIVLVSNVGVRTRHARRGWRCCYHEYR